MELPTLPNGRIDFEIIVRNYADEQQMTFAQTMKWLSERSSLQCACELMGIEIIGGKHETECQMTKRDILNTLGTFLDRKGYTVPKMLELGQTQFTRIEIDTKGASNTMTVDLTKDEYLALRLSGLKRNRICTDRHINPGSLYLLLEKWGIKDKADEERLLTAMREGQAVAKTSLAEIRVQAKSLHEPDPAYVTIRIPVTHVELPEVINTRDLDRRELMNAAFKVAQASVSWAYNDLVELVGAENVREHIQNYVDRRWREYADAN